ncbi:MAG: hypothetical protein IKU97_03720 [Tidjanibacter sp.]|nr:hypothetical protein [Tidjanibacter sp.]
MKKVFKFALWSVAVLLLGLTSCMPDSPEPGPGPDVITNPIEDAALTIKINSVSIDGAKGAIATSILNEVVYVVEPKVSAKEYTAEELFELEAATLLTLECDEDGTAASRVNIEGLADNTEYTIQLAGRLNASTDEEEKLYVFETVVSQDFTTSVRPTLTAEFVAGSATANSAKIKVTTTNISRFGYIAYDVTTLTESFTAPTAAIIFAEGTIINDVDNGDTEVSLNHLNVNSEYVIYIAGEIAESEEFFNEILIVDGIKTIDFSESIRFYDITYNSFKLDVKAPANLVEQKHVIKWATTDLYTFNNKIVYGSQTGRPSSIPEAMNLNDQSFGNYFNKSTTLIFDEEHSYKLDSSSENGSLTYYDPFVPGQPQVVMMGEFRWGESYVGWGYGYYVPLFDTEYFMWELDNARTEGDIYAISKNQDKYWDEGAFFHKSIVQIKKPELLTKKVNATVESRPDGAAIIIEPETGIDHFAIYVENDEVHATLVNLLDGEQSYKEHIQWWITSYAAMMEGAQTFTRATHFPDGVLRLELTNFFYEYALTREDTYRVHIVGLADDNTADGFMDGHIQNYSYQEFQLKPATEPEPSFELTFVPEKSTSTKAVFNLRSTNPASNVRKAYYVANSERAWHQINGSCQALVDTYGNLLEGTDIDAINSPEGLDIPIPTFPNECVYMAAKVSNIDGSRIYSEAPVKSDIARAPQSYLDLTALYSLAGDWTATATIGFNEKQTDDAGNVLMDQNGNEITKWVEQQVTTKITLGGEATYPATLPESVYQIFADAKVSREKADQYFEEFKTAADAFNYNLRNSNQILCKGWGFDTTGYINATYADAYELFASKEYNGAYSSAAVYDFGPKWYIETDGTNYWVPFNTNTYMPLSSHTTLKTAYGNFWQEYHLVGNSGTSTRAYGDIDPSFKWYETGYYADGRFPVEISNGGNTITIKPVDIEVVSYKENEDGSYTETGRGVQTFYPCAAHNSDNSGDLYFASRIISDIVMTRGYTEPATPAVAKAARSSKRSKVATQKVASHQEIIPVAKMRSITSFEGAGVKTYEYPIIGIDEFHNRNRQYLKSLGY